MDVTLAAQWDERWDRQQARYIADREQRFDVCLQILTATAPRDRPMRVLDLGCGPGSFLRRIAASSPHASLIGVDRDPVLVGIARARCPGASIVDADLTDPSSWAGPVRRDGPLDAVVSSTALHWLPVEAVAGLYRVVATLLRPGGVLLDADHLYDPQPAIAALAAHLRRHREHEKGVADNEDWASWWRSVAQDPDLAALVHERAARGVSDGWSNQMSVTDHTTLLRDAGFAEVGPLWQYGNDVVLAAVR